MNVLQAKNFSNLAFQTAHGYQMRQPPPKKYTPPLSPLPNRPTPTKNENFSNFPLTLGGGGGAHYASVYLLLSIIVARSLFVLILSFIKLNLSLDTSTHLGID